MACTDRFSFRAIDGLSRPDASNVKSCASSAGVHGRPVGRGPSFIWLSHLQPPALHCSAFNTAQKFKLGAKLCELSTPFRPAIGGPPRGRPPAPSSPPPGPPCVSP